LQVIDSGRVEGFQKKGTLLAHANTGDQVFVAGELLSDGDINDRIEPVGTIPKPTVRRVDSIELNLVRLTQYEANGDTFEVFQLRVRNTANEAITNLSDLDVRFSDASRLDIGAVNGATLDRGTFELFPNSIGVIGPGGDTGLFTFEVRDRPAGISVTTSDFSADNFTPRGEDGQPVNNQVGFRLQIREIDPFENGGSVEVFIRNVGNTPITNLEDAVFEFLQDNADITAVWGARERDDDILDVIPWSGDARGDLSPGERTKLFGFSYEFSGDDRPDIDVADFALVSRLGDLLA
ncbi:MAG: hypothetical protein AAFW98_07600, partial [Pseudomonadota bacterium]